MPVDHDISRLSSSDIEVRRKGPHQLRWARMPIEPGVPKPPQAGGPLRAGTMRIPRHDEPKIPTDCKAIQHVVLIGDDKVR
jgi:hypothetical protein